MPDFCSTTRCLSPKHQPPNKNKFYEYGSEWFCNDIVAHNLFSIRMISSGSRAACSLIFQKKGSLLMITSHKFLISLYFILSVSITSTLYSKGLEVDSTNFNKIKKELWNQYVKDVQNLASLKKEYHGRALKFSDKTMRFSLEKRGTEPVEGYPLYIALHGGGATSSDMNDSQWEDMKTYYKGSVTAGIYVATRGITDSWMLHSENESYPLYDKLIESAILFDHVNPNRVYILGFSAGGDGVYQIAPRMANRFAAANMSAGHHNGITFDNLYNTPFLMQVGENDSAFNRNKVAAENNIAFNKLNTKYGSGFIHDLFIHYNGSHNSWRDNDVSRRDQRVIADPVDWLNGNRKTKTQNSNAIDWLNQYSRQPLPNKLVWDLSVGTLSRSYQTGSGILSNKGDKKTILAQPETLFYWLDVSPSKKYPEKGKLVVEIDKSINTIIISEIKDIDKFRILLNPDLLDLSAPVHVEWNGHLIGTINVTQKIEIMNRTLLERSDINQIFDGEIILTFNQETGSFEIM